MEQMHTYKEAILKSLVRIDELLESPSTASCKLPGTSPADSRNDGHESAFCVKLLKLQFKAL